MSQEATERFGCKGDGALVEKVEDERVGVGGLGIGGQLCALDVFELRHFVHLSKRAFRGRGGDGEVEVGQGGESEGENKTRQSTQRP